MTVAWLESPSPLDPLAFALYMLAAVFAGVSIGAVGIGGVLIVPLMLAINVDVNIAMTSSLASFLFAGITGVIAYARRGCLSYVNAGVLCAGVAPMAAVASLLLPHVPPVVSSSIIACTAIWCGLTVTWKTLRSLGAGSTSHGSNAKQTCNLDKAAVESELGGADKDFDATASAAHSHSGQVGNPEPRDPGRTATGKPDAEPGEAPCETNEAEQPHVPLFHFARRDRGILFGVGMVVGFGSVMTATGGPFVLLPLIFLAYPKLPAAQAVAFAQSASIPISCCSTLVSSVYSKVDLGLAACTTGCLMIGVPFGAWLAVKVRQDMLKLVIALVLVAIGARTLVLVIF